MSSNNYDYLSDLFIDEVKDLPGPGGGKPSEDTRFLDFVEGKMTELTDADITTIGDQAFYYNQNITKVDLPNLADVGDYAFNYSKITSLSAPKLTNITSDASFYLCSQLESVDLPMLTMDVIFNGVTTEKDYGNRLFSGCKKLETANVPNLVYVPSHCFQSCEKLTQFNYNTEKIQGIGSYAFYGCVKLVSLRFPNLVRWVYDPNLSSAFNGCQALEELHIPYAPYVMQSCCRHCYKLPYLDFFVATFVEQYSFENCYSLKTLCLRKEDKICSLRNTNAFGNCYHYHGTVDATYNPDGLKDGYIYVPRALIEDYKVATNWVTFADQFRALEDYTVDGTTTGEMDWDKINGGATT